MRYSPDVALVLGRGGGAWLETFQRAGSGAGSTGKGSLQPRDDQTIQIAAGSFALAAAGNSRKRQGAFLGVAGRSSRASKRIGGTSGMRGR